MTVAELTNQARYVTDAEGNRQAIQLDLAVWEELVALIEELEAEDRQQLLEAVAESRQAYQTGQVERGTADDLIATLEA